MTSALVMKNSHFVELTSDEMMFVDGGSIWKALEATAGALLIGAAPLGGILAGIGASVVGTPVVGVAAGIGAAATMVSYGSSLLDNATKK